MKYFCSIWSYKVYKIYKIVDSLSFETTAPLVLPMLTCYEWKNESFNTGVDKSIRSSFQPVTVKANNVLYVFFYHWFKSISITFKLHILKI